MSKSTLILCILVAIAQSASGQVPGPADPKKMGMHVDRLQRIDHAIEAAIAAREIPGAVALIARDGVVVYHRSFGFADLESRKPMEASSIFRIASMTKAITTTSVMMLYERGHFLLSDPVSDYLPEFANPKIAVEIASDGTVAKTMTAKQPIRIIDLLEHTAGIAYPFRPSNTNRAYVKAGIIDGLTSKPLRLENHVRLIAEQPLLFEPGSAFAYGLNTDVLGYLIEVVSGKSLAEFFRDEIFEPLQMGDTHFYLPESKKDRLVTLYADVDGEGISIATGDEGDIILDNPDYPVEGAKTLFSGGAGLSSTTRDYARFLQMLLNDGELDGRRLLSRKSVELMRTSRIDLDGDGDTDLGLGFSVIDDLGEQTELGSVGSYAWGGAFYTSYWIDPKERLIGVFMSQVRPAKSDIDRKFNALVYQAIE